MSFRQRNTLKNRSGLYMRTCHLNITLCKNQHSSGVSFVFHVQLGEHDMVQESIKPQHETESSCHSTSSDLISSLREATAASCCTCTNTEGEREWCLSSSYQQNIVNKRNGWVIASTWDARLFLESVSSSRLSGSKTIKSPETSSLFLKKSVE